MAFSLLLLTAFFAIFTRDLAHSANGRRGGGHPGDRTTSPSCSSVVKGQRARAPVTSSFKLTLPPVDPTIASRYPAWWFQYLVETPVGDFSLRVVQSHPQANRIHRQMDLRGQGVRELVFDSIKNYLDQNGQAPLRPQDAVLVLQSNSKSGRLLVEIVVSLINKWAEDLIGIQAFLLDRASIFPVAGPQSQTGFLIIREKVDDFRGEGNAEITLSPADWVESIISLLNKEIGDIFSGFYFFDSSRSESAPIFANEDPATQSEDPDSEGIENQLRLQTREIIRPGLTARVSKKMLDQIRAVLRKTQEVKITQSRAAQLLQPGRRDAYLKQRLQSIDLLTDEQMERILKRLLPAFFRRLEINDLWLLNGFFTRNEEDGPSDQIIRLFQVVHQRSPTDTLEGTILGAQQFKFRRLILYQILLQVIGDETYPAEGSVQPRYLANLGDAYSLGNFGAIHEGLPGSSSLASLNDPSAEISVEIERTDIDGDGGGQISLGDLEGDIADPLYSTIIGGRDTHTIEMALKMYSVNYSDNNDLQSSGGHGSQESDSDTGRWRSAAETVLNQLAQKGVKDLNQLRYVSNREIKNRFNLDRHQVAVLGQILSDCGIFRPSSRTTRYSPITGGHLPDHSQAQRKRKK